MYPWLGFTEGRHPPAWLGAVRIIRRGSAGNGLSVITRGGGGCAARAGIPDGKRWGVGKRCKIIRILFRTFWVGPVVRVRVGQSSRVTVGVGGQITDRWGRVVGEVG